MAAATAQQYAVGGEVGVVAFQTHVQLVAAQACAEFKVDTAVMRIARQRCIGAQQAGSACAVGLHAGVRELRALCKLHLH